MSSERKKTIADLFAPFKPFTDQLKHIEKKVAQVAIAFQPIIEKLEMHRPEILKFLEGLQHWDEKSKELALELKKDDVFLIPYFASPSAIYELTDKIKAENKSMLEIYDEFFSEEENVIKLLDSWMVNPFFRERRQVFECCLNAHTKKNYILTIPIFYIHIEKYCKHLLGLHAYYSNPGFRRKLEGAYQSDKDDEGISRFISDHYVVEFLTKQIFEHSPEYQKLVDPIYPNRNEVLHGDDLDYFNKKHSSLRCILLLDILSDMKPIVAKDSDLKPTDSVSENP